VGGGQEELEEEGPTIGIVLAATPTISRTRQLVMFALSQSLKKVVSVELEDSL